MKKTFDVFGEEDKIIVETVIRTNIYICLKHMTFGCDHCHLTDTCTKCYYISCGNTRFYDKPCELTCSDCGQKEKEKRRMHGIREACSVKHVTSLYAMHACRSKAHTKENQCVNCPNESTETELCYVCNYNFCDNCISDTTIDVYHPQANDSETHYVCKTCVVSCKKQPTTLSTTQQQKQVNEVNELATIIINHK